MNKQERAKRDTERRARQRKHRKAKKAKEAEAKKAAAAEAPKGGEKVVEGGKTTAEENVAGAEREDLIPRYRGTKETPSKDAAMADAQNDQSTE